MLAKSGILYLHLLTLLEVSALQFRQGVFCVIRICGIRFLEVFLDAFTCTFLGFLVGKVHLTMIVQHQKKCTFSAIKLLTTSEVSVLRNACLVCASVRGE